MIIVAHPQKPFTLTPKGTPKRQAILKDYEDEIEAVYAAVEETSMSDVKPPATWDEEGTLSFIRVR